MPIKFDIIQLVNRVRQGEYGDEELENCPFSNESDNPLLNMSSIGLLPEDQESEGASLKKRVSLICFFFIRKVMI